MVKLHTNHGIITLELDAAKAPKTVDNFLQYVHDGFFDGTIFHRVIDGFMIQGGGFEPGMKQKPTSAPIKNEAANGLKNETYTVAMARTADPQFGHRAVLHQRGGQRASSTTPRRRRRAGATPCSARWSRAWTSWTRSRRCATGNRGGHQDVPLADVVIEQGGDRRRNQ